MMADRGVDGGEIEDGETEGGERERVSAGGGVEKREVDAADDGLRLDRWFRAHFPSLGHGALEKMLRKGQIRVDGGRVKASRRLAAGEVVRIPPMPAGGAERVAGKEPPTVKQREAALAAIRQMTVFEDGALIALNKPSGLAVQGGSKTTRHIDGMLAALERDGERPRLVHRLDRDTGGLLVLAKTRRAAAALGASFQQHDVDKTYWALVKNAPDRAYRGREGVIDLPVAKRMRRIGGGAQERVAPADGEDAKKAVTLFQTVDAAGDAAFMALRPLTGRTHQLRVHCAAIGSPIVGDRKYGGAGAVLEGVADGLHLFCREMTFPHPETGRAVAIAAPLSDPMLSTWRFFSFNADADVEWPDAALPWTRNQAK